MMARNTILGFGITGQSVARYLLAQGEYPVVLDTRAERTVHADFAGLEIHWNCESWPDQILSRTETVLVSPGLPLNNWLLEKARSAGLSIVSDIDLFFTEVSAPVIGVTGTNGKSTVVSLVGHILSKASYRCAVGGNLGKAALDLLDEEIDFFVLELSSFQLEHSKNLPLAQSVILNISADHLDHHGSLANYVSAKKKILADAKSWIYSREDASTRGADSIGSASFGFDEPSSHCAWGLAIHNQQEWIFRGELPVCSTASLPLQGRHNLLNCMAAMALVEPWLEPGAAANYMCDFKGLAHRFEAVAEIAGVAFVNDSKATNVGSTVAALDALELKGNVILIAGGDAKGADLGPLARSLVGRVKRIVALGKDARSVVALADKCAIPSKLVTSVEAAVVTAAKEAASGDLVLLSPACSSLDMYDSFQQRGDVFVSAVRGLTAADFSVVKA